MEIRAEKLETKNASTKTGDWLMFAGAVLLAAGKILNTS